eukprot:g134.t1
MGFDQAIIKTITWRLVAMVISGGASYAISRDPKTCVSIMGSQTIAGSLIYYAHEKAWDK